MSYNCLCSVALPDSALGWSVVFECDTSWSYTVFDSLRWICKCYNMACPPVRGDNPRA